MARESQWENVQPANLNLRHKRKLEIEIDTRLGQGESNSSQNKRKAVGRVNYGERIIARVIREHARPKTKFLFSGK